ncbi:MULTISPECIES: tRNA pseudouridine(55) synthase TruB [unclassified Synechococcus]|uniref:tRNA pseudouridine(55) synthase TruB n=1 Tax=unclassified Synechococcus TaxID=2626047 RepID=UPI00006943A5|nr:MULTISPECIES: tRNA pseudouridine(55) synthase TruB [unclassified Synechococcus]ABC99514.1 tRNA pseudouridine synthase B [Synechococcus sp. JA-3-3Ab]PIK88428.1 tRNA pseudouridine synthase B [Synechococcus sp. 65AY6A5]PIK94219.1 tRNA pseudouridine synthase B [Synechococcus sp. 60AY4M2]PIL00463.1 tRNA pseudouridine synthase B [Synechococcus sp. 65AY640]
MGSLEGFLNLDKPAGLTSHDCVAVVRRVLRTRQVGHGGTLDPAATGVLPIAVGRATRFLAFLSGDKVYRATFRFGQRSDTDDAEGQIQVGSPCPELSREQVEECLREFVGEIWQVPPLYSAIKRQGKKLYELARAGAEAAELGLEPRRVVIRHLQILGWRSGEFPEVDLEIACGPGTYIRALARDVGEKLGCGGLMSRLRRLQSGPFRSEESLPLEQWQGSADPAAALLPIEWGFRSWNSVFLSPAEAQRWRQGQAIPLDPAQATAETLRVMSGEGEFLGLGHSQAGQLKPLRVLLPDP